MAAFPSLTACLRKDSERPFPALFTGCCVGEAEDHVLAAAGGKPYLPDLAEMRSATGKLTLLAIMLSATDRDPMRKVVRDLF